MVRLVISREFLRSRLAYFGLAFLLIQSLWTLVFRSHVYVHFYAHWFYAPAIVLILVAVLRGCDVRKWLSTTVSHVLFFVLVILLWTSDTPLLHNRATETTFGTSEDIAAIQKVTGRVVILRRSWSGPRGWWTSPVPRLYCDQIWRGSEGAQLIPVGRLKTLRPGQDTIVVRDIPAVRAEARRVAKEFGFTAERVVLKSPSFVFLAVE